MNDDKRINSFTGLDLGTHIPLPFGFRIGLVSAGPSALYRKKCCLLPYSE